MLPPPPGLFSTTAGWLRLACRPVAISRATTSFEPPGVNGTMMRIVLLGKRASARPASGQRFGNAAAPASAAISVRRDVKQRAIEGPPEFEDVDLRQFYQGVGPAASGTGRPFCSGRQPGLPPDVHPEV